MVELWFDRVEDFAGDAAVEAVVNLRCGPIVEIFWQLMCFDDPHASCLMVVLVRICFQARSSVYIDPRYPSPFKDSGCRL